MKTQCKRSIIMIIIRRNLINKSLCHLKSRRWMSLLILKRTRCIISSDRMMMIKARSSRIISHAAKSVNWMSPITISTQLTFTLRIYFQDFRNKKISSRNPWWSTMRSLLMLTSRTIPAKHSLQSSHSLLYLKHLANSDINQSHFQNRRQMRKPSNLIFRPPKYL
mgnify:CR=1 FL=1